MLRTRTSAPLFAIAFTLAVANGGSAQEAPALTPADYGQFENLGAFELDPTGTWLVNAIRRVDETVELRLQRADASGDPLVLEHGTSPEFSRDGRWIKVVALGQPC